MRRIYTSIIFRYFGVDVYEESLLLHRHIQCYEHCKALDKMYLYEIHHISIPTFLTVFILHCWHALTFSVSSPNHELLLVHYIEL